MVMDAVIDQAQAADLYTRSRRAGYTPINGVYHYSWHPNNRIVVGVGRGPGHHRNFTCNISNAVGITLDEGPGFLEVGGAGGINPATLRNSVSSVLKARFRTLIRTANFNNMGRTPQRVTLQNTKIVNRFNRSTIIINLGVNSTEIAPGQSHTFVNGFLTGFAVVRHLADGDTYYRNLDVRENVVLTNGEPLRIMQADPSTPAKPVTLTGTVSGAIEVEV
ncbi:hypothetical protein [Trinickia dinghuensis]|uniref:hypothetical protein n=1 Tax=Trinickia dinghuensis TaxID=2291023 RepID=UPI0011C06914|nr:hypothetical protein [Trinickia dinghuensis]